MIDPANTLYVLIQVSVALAGFAGIVSAVREDHREQVLRYRLFTLLYCSFSTLFAAAFALVLLHGGIAEAETWRAMSALIVVLSSTGAALSWRRANAVIGLDLQFRRLSRVILINGTLAAMIGLLIYNAIDWAQFWPVLIGILWPFGLACYAFAQLLFGTEEGAGASTPAAADFDP